MFDIDRLGSSRVAAGVFSMESALVTLAALDVTGEGPSDGTREPVVPAHEVGTALHRYLDGVSLDEVPEALLVDAALADEREMSASAARQARVIAALARRRPAYQDFVVPGEPLPVDEEGRAVVVGSDSVVDEISLALAVSVPAAEEKVQTSLDLVHRLPWTMQALERGRLDVSRARLVCSTLRDVSDEVAAAVDERVVRPIADGAGRPTHGTLRARLRKAVLALDPRTQVERERKAAEKRRCTLQPEPDGMAWVGTLLPAADAAALWTAIDAAARASGGADDKRTLDQKRADAHAAMGWAALAAGHAGCCTCDGEGHTGPAGSAGARAAGQVGTPFPSVRGERPHIRVVVGAGTLLGLDDEPAELGGYGPISADMARRIAADGVWTRILVDPETGMVRDVGTTRYEPPADMARFVVTRDRLCTFATCRQPAERCDLDHEVPFPAGPTSCDNLGARCRRHHHRKQQSGWSVRRQDDGTTVWTSPTGHRYVNAVEPYWPPPSSAASSYDAPPGTAADRDVPDAGHRDLPPPF